MALDCFPQKRKAIESPVGPSAKAIEGAMIQRDKVDLAA